MFSMTKKNYTLAGILILIAIMAATRIHHFGSALSLPDASLAVFFLMGLLSGNRWLLGLLLLLAGLLDYIAINQFGVSDWCISPAYIFLIPTYAILWFAGRYCSRFKSMIFKNLALQFGVLFLATSTAFVISNASFYLLSENVSDLSLMQYSQGVVQYYLPYLSTTLIYSVVLYAAAKMLSIMLETTAQDQTV
jgi:hypothetical protein